MKIVNRDQVLAQIERDPNTPVVEVLPEEMFRKFHLPGAVNVPLDDDDFDRKIQQAAPDKSEPVIVYCYDSDCDASPKAAQRMEELGYEEVLDYGGGKLDWKEAGLEVAS